jgi:hypothetical protein
MQEKHINVANKYFENVAEILKLWTKLTDQICIHNVVKRRLNFGECLPSFISQHYIYEIKFYLLFSVAVKLYLSP